MAKQFFLHLIAFLFITNLFSQEYTFLKEIKLDIEAENYLTDQLGNVYLLHKDRIIKHDLNNNNEYEYSNNEMGSISYVDVSDPLRILIYYNDFNQIVFLDNKLSEIGSPVSLDDIGHENTNIVCSSKDGGFWLFDHQNGQLFYYNEDLNMVNQSVSINSITDEEINPNYMIEKNQSVYLNIPD